MGLKELSRRRLIQDTAIGGLALSVSPRIFAKKKQKLGVALVGLGYYSESLLAPALQLTQHCELKGIVTGTPAKIPEWQKRYGIEDKNVYSYQNMHLAANNPEIDVFYIVVPTSLHKKYSVIAANAGKHVWCEKPMAMTKKECDDIISVCRKNNVQLTIGYRLHHEPNTQTVNGFARSRPYGDITSVIAEAGYAGGALPQNNWRLKRNMGGGALYDMGVYPINAARNAVGMEPIAVSAVHEVLRSDVFTEVDESTYFTLFFPDGIRAACATSVGKNMNMLKVTCSNGWYELVPMQAYSGVIGRTSDGKLLNKPLINQQTMQMDNDALAIINGTSPLVPGSEGVSDIIIVEAALKSASKGGAKVAI